MSVFKIHTSVKAPKPTGSKFTIEQLPFYSAGTHPLIETAQLEIGHIDEARFYDWPMVYVLANASEAYVGQTTSVVNRMNQHGANPEKAAFTTCNLIYNEEFNHSVLDHYEHWLIEYMNADGKYKLTNKNSGLTDYEYFGKAEYSEMFKELWDSLREYELIEKSLDELADTEVFKYSPFKALNPEQDFALKEIIREIENVKTNPKPIVVEGMPGTGKTVLAIYLLKAIKDNPIFEGLNVKLLEPIPALKKTLQDALKGVLNLSSKDVIGPSDLVKPEYGFEGFGKKGIDILLVDEAHKLKRYRNIVNRGQFKEACSKLGLDFKTATQLDWALACSRIPILFFDPLQVIGPSGLGLEDMKRILGPVMDKPLKLESQMRVKGGKSYLDHIESVLHGSAYEKFHSDDYEFVIHDDFHEFRSSFEEKLNEHSLTRMAAGFAWPWATKNKPQDQYPDSFDIEIEGIKLRWNLKPDNWVGIGLERPEVAREVGCIHSLQGYDLSYAYVIIGPDFVLGPNGIPVANKDSYFDKNGKNGIEKKEELDSYIRNIYYVLLSRGIYGTHIYVCDKVLRDYIKQYFA